MLNKRFNVFEVKECERVLSRLKKLFKTGQEDLITKEFKNTTNYIWDSNGNFFEGNDDEGSLDIVVMKLKNTNKDAILYLAGDIFNGSANILYVVRNEACDVIEVATVSTIEELVNVLNKELEFLTYYDNIFGNISDKLSEKDLRTLYYKYEDNINEEYFFNNFDYFRQGYLYDDKFRFNELKMKALTEDLLKMI